MIYILSKLLVFSKYFKLGKVAESREGQLRSAAAAGQYQGRHSPGDRLTDKNHTAPLQQIYLVEY